MEKYFNSVSKNHYRGEKLEDIHPENAYQVKIKKLTLNLPDFLFYHI
jgi:hypothetical protein